MYSAPIVVGEMKGTRGLKVVEFLAVSQSEPSKPFHRLADGQVGAFHVTCRDVARIGPSITYSHYCLYHRRWRVPPSSVMLPVVAVYLYHLSKISLSRKYLLNSALVKMESVRCELEAMFWRNPVTQASQKLYGRFAVSLADRVGGNQFCLRVNGDKDPSIAEFFGILCAYMALFLAAECPNFIALNLFAAEVLHLRFHQLYATFASEHEQAHDRIPVQLRNALSAPNAGAFDQQLNRQQCSVFRHCHRSKQPRMFFCIGLPALRTAESLKTIAVFPKLLTFDLALGAIHE
jgi:hypothetical protein